MSGGDHAGARYDAILTAIVQRFVRLIGAEGALQIARRVPHLEVDAEGNVRSGRAPDPLGSITQLVDGYAAVLGQPAAALARKAVGPLAAEVDPAVLALAGLEPPPAAVTRLLLVDDHPLFRNGLMGVLVNQSDLAVVGQAGSVQEAVALARDVEPDVVLMDFSLSDGTGLEAATAILAHRPAAKIIFLTVHDDDERLFAAIRAGAMGYMLKNVRTTELLQQVRAIARGEPGISPAVAHRIIKDYAHLSTRLADAPDLTQRELEIVAELARGLSNREIARRFVISENTVKNHVRNVLAKLHLRNRREIAAYARARGLTSPFNTFPPS